MIRIKDYIFNENEIVKIQFDDGSKEMEIDHKNGNRTFIDGTFDDIEWNYGNTDLEELKFAMQDTSDSANDTCGELQQRINKALEYIKEKSIICDKWVEVEPLQLIPVGRIDYKSLNKKNVEELSKILKGKEK